MPVMVKRSEGLQSLEIVIWVGQLGLLIFYQNGRHLSRLLKFGEKKGGNEMKISLREGRKLYLCDSCYAEVYSLICRFIDGEWVDVCSDCLEEEVKE